MSMDRAEVDRRVDILTMSVNTPAGVETYSHKALFVPAAEGR
jgi:hypothetical protein